MEEVSDDGDNVCPLCMEEMDLTDKQLKACRCGYEICVWCWHHIMEMAEKDNVEGRCPACRIPYDKERIVGMTVNCERLTDFNSEKRQKAHKSKPKASEGRKHLSNVRVIQRNLVYVIGIPASLADEKILERREFFGQYGKILKVSVSRSSSHSSQHSTSGPTSSVYITFVREDDAFRCIQAVNGYVLEGRPLRACFGTTKYCYAWLKNMPCSNPDCLYLHDIGTQEDSFTKEEMLSKCGSKTQQFYDLTNPSQQRWGYCLPPPAAAEGSCPSSTSSSKPSAKSLASSLGSQTRTMPANGTTGKSNVLPASASWASHAAQEKTLPLRTAPLLGSGNSKSNSYRALSVSPPSNLSTSAAVVAAAAMPGLTCDQGKPSLVALGGHALHSSGQLSSFISAKQSSAKHHVSNGADATLNACVKASAATATPEIYTSKTGFSGKERSGINSGTKFGVLEGFVRGSKNLSCNWKEESSELGSVHECKMVENEGTDSVSAKHHVSNGADAALNARVKASAATATPEIYTSKTAFSGKERSGINSGTKFGILEGFVRGSKNLSCDSKEEASELGSVHECKMVENEGTDSVSAKHHVSNGADATLNACVKSSAATATPEIHTSKTAFSGKERSGINSGTKFGILEGFVRGSKDLSCDWKEESSEFGSVHECKMVENEGTDSVSAKHHVSNGADAPLNAFATATAEIYTSKTAFSGKERSGINSGTKFGILEGFVRGSKNLSCNWKEESSELSSMHECKMVENEGTDSVSVSSSIHCGQLWKDGLLNSVSQCTNEANASVVNNSAFDSRVNENQQSLPSSNSSADLLQKYGMSCPEISLIESMKELGMTSSEDSSCLSYLEEQSTDVFVNRFSESARKPRGFLDVGESNDVSDSQMPTRADEVEGPVDVATLTNGSVGVSLSVGDLSISLQPEPLNNGIQGDHDGTGSTDHEVKDGSGSSAANITVDSVQSITQESLLDTAEQSVGIRAQTNEHLDISTNSDIKAENSECLDKMKNNIVQEEKMVDTDVGESSIIANILSMNFDISEDASLASPHNLAKLLLSEKDTGTGFSKDISSSWKSQNSKQSRFSFARQEDSKEGSDVTSIPCLTSTGQLQREWSNGKNVLGDRNEYDQVKKLSNDVSASNVNGYQTISKGDTPHISFEATVVQPLVSRSLYSSPPGFSVPNRMLSVPPPGFCSQTKVDTPHEQATAAFTDGNQVLDNSNMYLSAYNQTHVLANSTANDVEFIDPAIMVVGKGKLPMASSQPGSVLHDSNFTGLLQHNLSNANVGHALHGFGTPFSHLNPIDYDGRHEMFKQRAFCNNSNLASSRQQLQFPDQVGDTFSSYLPSQNDAVLPSRIVGHTQANFNALFCQQPANSLLRSSSTCPNGWSNWNRMNSAVESGLVTRRMEPGLADITSNERIGPVDSKVGWMRMLPSYNDAKFHKPNSDDFYSRILFDM